MQSPSSDPVPHVPERLRSAVIVHLGILMPSTVHLGRARTSNVQSLKTLHWILSPRISSALGLLCSQPIFLTDGMFCEPALLLKWRWLVSYSCKFMVV